MPVELNLQNARLSPANFRQMFAKLPDGVDSIQMHPYQTQWYEEQGFVDGQSLSMGPFDGVSEVPPITVGGVPLKEDIRMPKNVVRFFRGDELIGEITNLAEPILN